MDMFRNRTIIFASYSHDVLYIIILFYNYHYCNIIVIRRECNGKRSLASEMRAFIGMEPRGMVPIKTTNVKVKEGREGTGF